MSVSLEMDGKQLGTFSLGTRRNGLDYPADERATLQQIATMGGSTIALTGKLAKAGQ